MLRIVRLESTKQLAASGACWRQARHSSPTSSFMAGVSLHQSLCQSTITNQRSSIRFSAYNNKGDLGHANYFVPRGFDQPASRHAPFTFMRPCCQSQPSLVANHHHLDRRKATSPTRRYYSSKPPTSDKDAGGKEEHKETSSGGANRARLAKLVETSVVPTLKRVEDSVIPTLKRVEDSVKPTLKRVTEWYAGDLFTVYAIAILFIFVVTAPTVSRHMRNSEVDFEQVDSDDAIAHTEILARQILYNLDGEHAEKESSIPKATDLLQTIMTSEPLKDALIKLINKVLESEEFQTSAKQLVRGLWDDLVSDPETTDQVVHLLNHVIQTEEIQHAAQDLVIKIVNDKAVFDELIELLHRIGQDHEVLTVVQQLLMQSAHNALNDEEILDHSMEFVADVVADDTIQRTTGDAIRQTVSHAVRPALSALLIATGVGFLLLSLSALSNARLTDREVRLMEQSLSQISNSIQKGAAQAIPTVISVTGRLLSRLEKALSASLRRSGSALSQLGISTWNATTRWLVLFPFVVAHSIGSIFVWTGRSVTHGIVMVSSAAISSLSMMRFWPPNIATMFSVISVPAVALRSVGALFITSMQHGFARVTTIILWPFGMSDDNDAGSDHGSSAGDVSSLKMKVD